LDKKIDVESLSHDITGGSVWVYSSKPVMFFQTVMQNKHLISTILVSTNGKTKHYESFNEFKNEFNPQQQSQNKQTDGTSYDDEIF